MTFKIFFGIMIPFFGTLLGTGCVLFMKDCLSPKLRVPLLGFAGGIMTAASVWSLLIPAIDYAESMGTLAFIPSSLGFLLGVLFLILLEWAIPKLRERISGQNGGIKSSTMMVLAVGLHNVPEGMAVGAVFAGLLSGMTDVTIGGALALAVGIAIQNVPEGAIVSMPLKSEGKSRLFALTAGVVSGIVEPIGAFVTLYAVGHLLPVLPYLLGFAAGAMIYVVVKDLIPETESEGFGFLGALFFALGFSVMMILDVTLG